MAALVKDGIRNAPAEFPIDHIPVGGPRGEGLLPKRASQVEAVFIIAHHETAFEDGDDGHAGIGEIALFQRFDERQGQSYARAAVFQLARALEHRHTGTEPRQLRRRHASRDRSADNANSQAPQRVSARVIVRHGQLHRALSRFAEFNTANLHYAMPSA